tara:strand:+ start:10079 stop:11266 length:1188 start_codon:yes stop_codon:yes gene_type:complete
MNKNNRLSVLHRQAAKPQISSALAVVFSLMVASVAAPANALVLLDNPNGFEATVNGSIPVYFANIREKGDGEDASRIMSSFNPANITFGATAPTANGITVTGTLQINIHMQGVDGDGLQIQDSGLFEGRVADIGIAGDFGTVNIGKGFGIFNSNAIGDDGSAKGIGRLFGAADSGNASGGRIGTGYVYANFNPRVIYTTPDINGLSFKVGAIQPEDPSGYGGRVETKLPRFEGQLTYAVPTDGGAFKVWSGFIHQDVDLIDVDYQYEYQGYDVGAHLDLGGLGLTANYSDTNGIGANGLYGLGGVNDAEVDATQWYVEADYTFGRTMLGVSYGEGDQDAQVTPVGSAMAGTNKMGMLFARHMLTPQLTLMGELQAFRSDLQKEYDLLALGVQFDF